MTRVPLYRNRAVELLRSGRQKAIFIGGVPVPADRDTKPVAGDFVGIRDEVRRKSELMRTLPRSRFRNPLGEQVRLPEGCAVRLEDFEQGLREAGLIGLDEILVKVDDSPTKFRAEKLDLSVNGVDCHRDSSFGDPSAAYLRRQSSASSKVTARNASSGGPVKAGERQRAFTGSEDMLHAQRVMIKRALLKRAKRGGF